MPAPHALQSRLRQILPTASLQVTALPDNLAIKLLLLRGDYPQDELDEVAARQAMDNPLYWIFCWASGQVLASYLLSNRHWVAGQRVVDFGCGSGVVAIAAALAGASEVIACDIDPLALEATAANARLNKVELTLNDDFESIEGAIDLIIVADVLYDRGNFPWLSRFVERAGQVLIADSRVKDFHYPPYSQIAECVSCTVPDLDESAEFRDVRIYLASR